MENAFAVARSKEKTCGICMETVMDKPKGEARFGILPNCNHCFCLSCLRTWRQAKQFEHKIIRYAILSLSLALFIFLVQKDNAFLFLFFRACPECRQTSDFICPSRFWVETMEEKQKLLSDYRDALNSKECKYFKRGEGECPFGNKCFYSHTTADGKSRFVVEKKVQSKFSK